MFATPQHSIDEGLGKFDLIAGVGDGKNTACAMSMLGWLAGHKEWSDNPICAHDSLSEIVIAGNDYHDENLPRLKTGPFEGNLTKRGEERVKARRANLVRLGYEGVLDTWWIPNSIIEWATESTLDDGNEYVYAVKVLKKIIEWKKERYRITKEYDKSGVVKWVRTS